MGSRISSLTRVPSILQTSTLLQKLKDDDINGAAAEFLRWDYEKVDGTEQPDSGLEARRKAEQTLFLRRTA